MALQIVESKNMSANKAQKAQTKINRIEADLRYLAGEYKNAAKQYGIDQDCADEAVLHLATALDAAKKAHKCMAVGVEDSDVPGVAATAKKPIKG